MFRNRDLEANRIYKFESRAWGQAQCENYYYMNNNQNNISHYFFEY